MLLTKEVEILVYKNKFKHYKGLGYFIPFKETSERVNIVVKIEDTPKTSSVLIKIKCDYCDEEYYTTFQKYNKLKKDIINKDACKKCFSKKVQESNIIKYGVACSLYIPEIRNKVDKILIDKYGYINPFNNKEIQDNIKKQWKDKYNVENPSQIDYIKEKRKITFIEKFGCENPSQNEEIKQKKIQTCLKNYGVNNPTQCPEIVDKVRIAFLQTMDKNNLIAYSKNQKYLNELLKGNLNYLFDRSFLDIAFPNEMIYLEYDGSGHDLSVRLNTISKEDFKSKEQRRYYSLKNRGWKMIRIISLKDKLPYDFKLIEMITYAKEYLNLGRSWIKFDIDNSKVINSQGEFDYDFGKLRKIKKEDLNN